MARGKRASGSSSSKGSTASATVSAERVISASKGTTLPEVQVTEYGVHSRLNLPPSDENRALIIGRMLCKCENCCRQVPNIPLLILGPISSVRPSGSTPRKHGRLYTRRSEPIQIR